MKEKDQKACQDCFNGNCPHKKSEDFLPNCPADPYILEMPWQEESWAEGPYFPAEPCPDEIEAQSMY
jgi:hypothetical protein